MSTPQTDTSQPPSMTGYAPYPGQQWGPPVVGQPVGAPQGTRSSLGMGHAMTLIGNIIASVGIIVLAFSLATVTVYPDYSTGFMADHFSMGFGAIMFTLGTLLVGIGALIRSFGVYLTAAK